MSENKCRTCGGVMDTGGGIYTCWACFDIDSWIAAFETKPSEESL
ncbi:hypothetical protein JCM9803A_10010 [Rhodococcus erythropolis]